MKTVVIIKGNPKFTDDNIGARKFYNDLKFFFEEQGYQVSFDLGEAYTVPERADLWVSHSRGSSRLRFAPEGVRTIALGTQGGINHPEDKALLPGQIPDQFHYVLTEEMKNEIKRVLFI